MFTIDSTYMIKRRGLLSFDNSHFLLNLYLPLIGYKASFIYLLFVNEYYSNKKEGNISYLINKTSLTMSDLLMNKKSLESVGLLRTLEKDNHYVFVLQSVLSPNDFFDDPVLKGLFVNKVGKDEALKIMKLYEIDDVDFSKYVDITAGVKESFEINFSSNDVNLNNNCEMLTINKNIIKDSFDDTILIEYIATKSHIDIKELTTEDIKEMHRLGVLYGLSEKIMGFILIDAYNASLPINHKIDYGFCNKRCKLEVSKYKAYNQKNQKTIISSNTDIANTINGYEETSPRIFLKNKQNGVEPVLADLNIIDFLSQNMGLSNGIINVILEYTLEKLDCTLNKKYVEKVAAAMKRKGIASALGAYNYLFGNKEAAKENTKKILKDVKKCDNEDIKRSTDDIKMDDKELEKLL